MVSLFRGAVRDADRGVRTGVLLGLSTRAFVDGPLRSVPHSAFYDGYRPRYHPGDFSKPTAGSLSAQVRNRKIPTSDVSRASALWTVSICERAGRPIRTPCSTGSLARFSRAPITPHETDDRFAPSQGATILY